MPRRRAARVGLQLAAGCAACGLPGRRAPHERAPGMERSARSGTGPCPPGSLPGSYRPRSRVTHPPRRCPLPPRCVSGDGARTERHRPQCRPSRRIPELRRRHVRFPFVPARPTEKSRRCTSNRSRSTQSKGGRRSAHSSSGSALSGSGADVPIRQRQCFGLTRYAMPAITHWSSGLAPG